MEFQTRRPAVPLPHQRRSSVPRLSIIVKDARFPDSKTTISPISPCASSPRTSKNRSLTTVVVMSPRLFSPAGTPTKILSPAHSRRGSEESTGRRSSRTSLTMGNRRRESIIYRNEQEYDTATAVVERMNTNPEDASVDEFPSTKSSVVTRVRAYSISTKNTRRRAARAAAQDQVASPIIVSGPRRRSSIVVVHNCSPSNGINREFSEMPEESEDES